MWYLLVLYVVVQITLMIYTIAFIYQGDEMLVLCKSPRQIYNTIKVNMFGAIMIFILLTIALPPLYLLFAIPKILFTVGRG